MSWHQDIRILWKTASTLLLSDLNPDHPTSDPLRRLNEDELATSTPYFVTATELSFSLLNHPGVYKRFSMSHVGRAGVVDLAFACLLLVPYFSECSDPLPSMGSDHIPILSHLNTPLFHDGPLSPNWALTDWPALESSLKTHTIQPHPALLMSRSMGTWFDTTLNRDYATLALHTPHKRVTHHSRPS